MKRGAYQPQDDYWRKMNPYSIMNDVSNYTVAEFVASNEDKLEKCGSNAIALLNCIYTTIQFCNSNPWDWNCKSLSECGDGKQTWHEQCDDGNNSDYDGCNQRCDYVQRGFSCHEPGKSCSTCLLDERAQWGDTNVCQFCLDEKFSDMKSPCYYEKCKEISSFEEAVICDNYVADYCGRIDSIGGSDPGCLNYKEQASSWTSVQPSTGCRYAVHNLDVNSGYMESMSILTINCPLLDPNNYFNDTTPYIWKEPLLYKLDRSNILDDLSKAFKAELELIEGVNPLPSLIPLHEAKLSDLIQNVVPKLKDTDGNLLYYDVPRLARLVPKEHQNTFDEYSAEDQCQYAPYWLEGEYEIISIPPCNNTIEYAIQAEVIKGMMNEHDSSYQDFSKINITDFNPTCNPVKNMYSGYIVLEKKFKDWTDETLICKECDYNGGENCWSETWKEENCSSLKDLIKDGKYGVVFDKNLYQSGCIPSTNHGYFNFDDCKTIGNNCKIQELFPRIHDAKKDDFESQSSKIVELIKKIPLSNNWSQLTSNFLKASIAAENPKYRDAIDLFNSLVVTGTKTVYIEGVENYCPYEWNSDDWLNDPCCNWRLRDHFCCAPKSVPDGEIPIVKSVNEDGLRSCRTPEKVRDILQDIQANLVEAQECANEVGESITIESWDEIWRLKDKCEGKVLRDGETDCKKDSDCFCSSTKCKLKDGEDSGKCVPKFENTPACFGECIVQELGPTMTKYLKESWGLDRNSSQEDFDIKFEEKMTAPTCIGDRMWEYDIGYPRMEWTCDTDCQNEHICSSYDYMVSLYGDDWQYNKEKCESIGFDYDDNSYQCLGSQESCEKYSDFEWTCYSYNQNGDCIYGYCEVSNGPWSCAKSENCHKKCEDKINDPTICENSGGVSYKSTPSSYSRECCPAGAYVIEENGYKSCKYFPEGTPNGYEIQNPTCCDA